MKITEDYEDLFALLNAHGIKYLIVGAYAVMYYSAPRFTKDIDVWISPDANNPQSIFNVLAEFGVPMKAIKPEDFSDKTMILQVGVPPVRIDIIMDLPALSFETAWKKKTTTLYGRTRIHLLGKEDLIKAKQAAGRPQDKLDLSRLAKIESKGKRKR